MHGVSRNNVKQNRLREDKYCIGVAYKWNTDKGSRVRRRKHWKQPLKGDRSEDTQTRGKEWEGWMDCDEGLMVLLWWER